MEKQSQACSGCTQGACCQEQSTSSKEATWRIIAAGLVLGLVVFGIFFPH